MISVQKFDRCKYDTEKCSFQIGAKTFNVSEGTYTDANDDELWKSPIWRGRRSNKEFRQHLWDEIQIWMPRYLQGGIEGIQRFGGSSEFVALMIMCETLKKSGKIKLIYISDRTHAELIARCVTYLASV